MDVGPGANPPTDLAGEDPRAVSPEVQSLLATIPPQFQAKAIRIGWAILTLSAEMPKGSQQSYDVPTSFWWDGPPNRPS
jgi:hypothetical protein